MTEFNVEEAGTKRVMLDAARERIVLADHTKFGRVMLNVVAPLSAGQAIISGAELDEAEGEAVREAGPRLILA